MAIDIEAEHIVPVREAPKHCPGRPHISAFYRWMNYREHPLETIRVGGRRFTSVQAIERFIRRCTSPDDTQKAQTTRARQRQIAAAEAELERAGI